MDLTQIKNIAGKTSGRRFNYAKNSF